MSEPESGDQRVHQFFVVYVPWDRKLVQRALGCMIDCPLIVLLCYLAYQPIVNDVSYNEASQLM